MIYKLYSSKGIEPRSDEKFKQKATLTRYSCLRIDFVVYVSDNTNLFLISTQTKSIKMVSIEFLSI